MVLRSHWGYPLSLAIFVEGRSDKLSIPILLRKLTRIRILTHIISAGDMLDVEEMSRHIRFLGARNVQMVIIFRDSECTDPEYWIAKAKILEPEFAKRGHKMPVRYVIVSHSLEGWLACDEAALRAVLGPRVRLTALPNVACACRPAEAMKQLFKRNGKSFNKVIHNPRIAENVEPRALARNSPTFAYLVSLVSNQP
ncbi:DUF4276 family protein [Chloroflexota bacterium]